MKVNNRYGKDTHSQQELLGEWKEYFNTILNNKCNIDAVTPSSVETDLPIDINPPTLEHTVKAILSLKRNKAAAVYSGTTPEAIKDGGEVMAILVHAFCHEVYTNKIPETVPTPKRVPDVQLSGITLMSICAKVYKKILLNRIQSAVDPQLRRNQAGFRHGCSCTQPLVVTFIDFRKAFISINHASMFAILRSLVGQLINLNLN